jgi:hypothetical protein
MTGAAWCEVRENKQERKLNGEQVAAPGQRLAAAAWLSGASAAVVPVLYADAGAQQ